MKKNKTLLALIIFILVFYILCFVAFTPDNNELFGWVILFLYIIIPIITIIYVAIVTASFSLSIFSKICLYLLNIFLYCFSIFGMFGYYDITDGFTLILTFVPTIFGLVIGLNVYLFRTHKNISTVDNMD